ncbi:MAG: hypothetical protein DMG73_02030 [Acidobacteria bacterium]|nr:MAG: hypothetical protein DMG73_02030 [Acidobacteriota bacterium]PYX66772.1 MAG: hypothetical protein DMG74_02725 [Acidobacteriota bacterium]
MEYVKGILSGVAAIFLAEFVPGPWSIFRGMSEQKATGLAAIAGGVLESLFSPLFWLLAILFFALFFRASRLQSNLLRAFLFWIPTLLVSTLGFSFVALCVYVFIRFRHH